MRILLECHESTTRREVTEISNKINKEREKNYD